MKYIHNTQTQEELLKYKDKYIAEYFRKQCILMWCNSNEYANQQIDPYENHVLLDESNNSELSIGTYDISDSIYYNLNRQQYAEGGINSKYNFGDILYIDGNNEIYVSSEVIDSNKGYTPIAVCCIPTGFFHIGSPARFVSCYGYINLHIDNKYYNMNHSYNGNASREVLYSYYYYTLIKDKTNTNNQLIYVDEFSNLNLKGSIIKYGYDNDDNNQDSNLCEYYYVASDKEINVNDTLMYLDGSSSLIANRIKYRDANYTISFNELSTLAAITRDSSNINKLINVTDSNNHQCKIIYGHNYNDTYKYSTYDNDTVILNDIFGYENTYLQNSDHVIDGEYYKKLKNNIFGSNELGSKIEWYVPAIGELVFLRMHIGSIQSICKEIQEKYDLYNYDMFQNIVDALSSTMYFNQSAFIDHFVDDHYFIDTADVDSGNEYDYNFVMNKNGWVTYIHHCLQPSEFMMYTYPMLQL